MSINWQDVVTTTLVTVGGGSAVLGAAAWLIRTIVTHKLDKEFQVFKEQLRAETDRIAYEHQVRFSKLHEKQGQVIADIYERLVEVKEYGESFVYTTGAGNLTPAQAERYNKTLARIWEFASHADRYRVYFPEEVWQLIQKVFDPLKKAVIKAGVYSSAGTPITQEAYKEASDAFMQAYKTVEFDVPNALRALEAEFRVMLGVQYVARPIANGL